MNQETTRRNLNKWYMEYNKPNLQMVADDLKISKVTLIQFKNNKADIGTDTLKKINRYIDSFVRVTI